LRKDLDAFFKATERWHLTSAERRALLGVSSEERWLESNRILGVCGAAKIDCSMPKQRRSAPSGSNRVVCNYV